MKYFLFIGLLIISCKSSLIYNSQALQGNFIISQLADNQVLPENLSLAFDSTENRIYGFSGCNRYFGMYAQEGEKLYTKDIALSNKLCLGSDLQNIEDKLLMSLKNIYRFELNDEVLKLFNKDGSVLLVAKKTTAEPVKNTANKDFTIKYQTKTMLGEKTIEYKNSQLSCTDGKNTFKKTLSEDQINDLKKSFTNLNLEKLNSYEAPSEQRHLDAAAYAILTIHVDNKSYKSKDFDHGNPPSALKELVSQITQHNVCVR